MPLRRLTHAPTGETGSVLIEALVSAAILLSGIVALFLALDVQTSASSDSRAASAAAGLAEADQERLRSFRVPQLSNRSESNVKTVGGLVYTVDSKAEWIRDATGGTQSCANSSTQADYLRLTSTVTGPAIGQPRSKPVVIRSLVAPPVGQFGAGQGTLAISAAGGAGQPVAGASTTITGPASLSDSTNALGCAIFGYVPVGAYTVSLSSPGFVDPSGNATASGSATASEGTVNLTTLQYDRSGSVNVSFDTQAGSGATPVAANAASLSAAHVSVPGTGFRLFRPGTAQPTINASALFPFATPYTLYAGSCAAANPAAYDGSYFATRPGSVTVAAGGNTSVTVREPSLRLTLRTTATGALVHVRAKSTDAGCADVFDWNTTGDSTGRLLPSPALPFGHYSVCADSLTKRNKNPLPVTLTDPLGSSPQTIDLRSNTVTGVCP